MDFEGNADNGPNEILRGDDHGIVLLDVADVPTDTVDSFETSTGVAEVLADGKVFKVPPGDRFVTLKSSLGTSEDLEFHGFLYAAVTGDTDTQVFDSPGEFATQIADPLGIITTLAEVGAMQVNMERVRVNFDTEHYLTFIFTGYDVGSTDATSKARALVR